LSLAEDPKWELAILATVQGFYEKLLQSYVGGEIPIPDGLGSVSLQGHADVNQTLVKMHRWLRILDLAITPAMLRRAFSDEVDPEIAEAMLRHFTRKRESSEVNRDKADLVATFLYRHPRVPGQWEKRGFGLDGSLPLSPFEIALIEILAESDVPSLPEEHAQLLRLFDPLQEQAHKCRDLNALLESGIISQVREIKQSLDSSFFHPGVLATIAPYNAAFGRIFDRLFHTAAGEIKSYAQALQEQGGSILGNVDGVDVTVDHVAAMEESDLLNMDYSQALDKFRRVSKLKQALDRRPPVRRKPQLLKTPAKSAPEKKSSLRPMLDLSALRAAITPQQISSEENKLRKVEESVRVFVRVADPKFRQIVPMRFFNLTLTPQEADAYCVDNLTEKTSRAEVGRVLLRSVALFARMNTELEELKRADNSPTVWKLHADSLLVLLEIGRMLNETAARIHSSGHEPSGLDAAAMKVSLDKLRQCAERAVHQLSRNPAEKASAARAGAD
jgi:hypothetical protein